MRYLSVGACVAALVVGMYTGTNASSAQDAPGLVQRPGPGVRPRTLRLESGRSLHYALSIPEGYSEANRVPLVLVLHFGVNGGPGNGAGRDLIRLVVGPALADLGAVMIAPDSLGGSWESPDNQQAVMRLLDETMKAFNTDPRKVVVTGYSMGGRGTWEFAATFPDRFSAALPVAGRPPDAAGQWRVPVFAVHSRSDERAPIAPTIQRINELQKAGLKAQLVTLDEPTHFQMNLHVDGLKQAVPWLKALWAH